MTGVGASAQEEETMITCTRLFVRGIATAVLATALAIPATSAFAADGAGDVHGDTGAAWGPNDVAANARIAQLTASAHNGLAPSILCMVPAASDGRPTTSVAPHAAESLSVTPSSCLGLPPETRILGVTWQRQTTGYWCGPTTVSMASYYFGSDRSQATVASYIGTTTAGSDRNQVARGMNWVSGGSTYTPISAPSAETIISAVRADIGRSFAPVAVNTHETAKASDHYNNHPHRAIGHFMLAVGYTSGGQTVVIDDPAAGLPGGYEHSAPQFSITAASLATFVDDRGIVA